MNWSRGLVLRNIATSLRKAKCRWKGKALGDKGGNINENAKSQKYNFFTCLIAGVFGGVFASLSIVLFIYNFIDIDFVQNAKCGQNGSFHYCFFDEAWDSGEYLSAITTFYGTIITILIGLLAVLATLAFLVVRTSAGHHAQEAMENEVERYFGSNAAVESIQRKVGQITKERVSQETKALESRLEAITVALEENGYKISGTIKDEKETD